MNVAAEYAKLSSAQRAKVGCIIVKEDRVISIGYNGMPAGWTNVCEDVVDVIVNDPAHNGRKHITKQLKTKPEVIHAEANAIAKLAKSSESGESAAAFVTHAPCMECAKLIYTAGIKQVFFKEQYKDTAGIDFLKRCGIEVEHYQDDS